jgi:hypothetical protein
MRFLTIAAAATLLMLPATAPVAACELDAFAAEAQSPALIAAAPVTQELSAEEKKADDKKPVKKAAKKHSKKEKVEYMRAVPSQ